MADPDPKTQKAQKAVAENAKKCTQTLKQMLDAQAKLQKAKPGDQLAMLELQSQMDMLQQQMQLLSKLMKAQDQAARKIISNLR